MFKTLGSEEGLMKFLLILSIIMTNAFAKAGVQILIEHPRNPSHQIDSYKIQCDKKCAFQIIALNPAQGESDLKLETKVKDLWSMVLPKEDTINPNRVFYKIQAMDGEKKLEINIGHAGDYQGEEMLKFLKVISFIEDIKRSMRFEIEAGKK
ncbi:MAG: hypothetical protein ACJ749_11880 [Flavisolibacter sp.]